MRRIRDAPTRRYRTLIAVLLFSGLRISEALGLVWGNVDLRTGHLRVRYGPSVSVTSAEAVELPPWAWAIAST